jgi:hypothetical protein
MYSKSPLLNEAETHSSWRQGFRTRTTDVTFKAKKNELFAVTEKMGG